MVKNNDKIGEKNCWSIAGGGCKPVYAADFNSVSILISTLSAAFGRLTGRSTRLDLTVSKTCQCQACG